MKYGFQEKHLSKAFLQMGGRPVIGGTPPWLHCLHTQIKYVKWIDSDEIGYHTSKSVLSEDSLGYYHSSGKRISLCIHVWIFMSFATPSIVLRIG